MSAARLAGSGGVPTRQQVLGLYRQLVVASRSFRMSDPRWFLQRVRQEIYKTDRDPEERRKMFERGQRLLKHKGCIL